MSTARSANCCAWPDTLNRLLPTTIETFLAQHALPASYAGLIDRYFLPLAAWLLERTAGGGTLLAGLNGAQGTGKTTLAAFLEMALTAAGKRVVVTSLDDYYLTAAERRQLAAHEHPLLRTRGVPGTHDIALLTDCLDRLRTLRDRETLRLPAFDKARDDRASSARAVQGPVDLVLLEGWCVGSRPQAAPELAQPVNALEHLQDSDGRWRRYVNDQLAGPYADAFTRLGLLVFLQAPGMAAVRRWRGEQERKLAAARPGATAILPETEIRNFVAHFERLTRANLAELPALADAVVELGENHEVLHSYFRS